MKKILLILPLLLFLYSFCNAQKKELPVFDLFEDSKYSLKTTIIDDYEYQFVFINNTTKEEYSIIVQPFTEDKFKKVFDSMVRVRFSIDDSSSIGQAAKNAYNNIVYGALIAQPEPRYAGTLGVEEDIDVYNLSFLKRKNKRKKRKPDKNYKYKLLTLSYFKSLSRDTILELHAAKEKKFNKENNSLRLKYGILQRYYSSIEILVENILQNQEKTKILTVEIKDENEKLRKEKKKRIELNEDVISQAKQLRDIEGFNKYYVELNDILNDTVVNKYLFFTLIENWKKKIKENADRNLRNLEKKIDGYKERLQESEYILKNDSIEQNLLKAREDSLRYPSEIKKTQNKIDLQTDIIDKLLSQLKWSEISDLEETVSIIFRKQSLIEDKEKQLINADSLYRLETNKLIAKKDTVINAEFEFRNAFRTTKNFKDSLIKRNFEFEYAEFEIKDGFLEHVTVVGSVPELQLKEKEKVYNGIKYYDSLYIETVENPTLKFRNFSPFGFTRRIDYDALGYRHLYAHDREGQWYALSLGDLLSQRYIEKLQVGRKDFSPKDQTVRFDKNGKNPQKLEKESRDKLLKAVVFTDAAGINGENPNGLIQTELSKRLKMVTNKLAFQSPLYTPRNLKQSNVPWIFNVGTLGYLDAMVTFSKIENQNRELILERNDKIINGQLFRESFASTLDLRQYENFSTELGLNGFILDVPNVMSTITLDWVGRYGTVAISDSTRSLQEGTIITAAPEDYTVSTFSFGPKASIRVQGDESYFFNFSFSHFWSFLRDNRATQVANKADYTATSSTNRRITNEYNQVEITAGLNKIGTNEGQFFFRYRLFWQQGFWRTTFYQAQIGYAFSFFKNRNITPPESN